MKLKAKGSNAERELVHMFWDKGWAAIRVAGSGSSQYPSPDVLAGNNLRKLAVECKASGELNKYITVEQIENLAKFSSLFGAEPWVGIRFDRMDWLFLGLEDLERTESSYRITPSAAKRKGLLFDELIR
jgi:holliday junction resolvase Hjr